MPEPNAANAALRVDALRARPAAAPDDHAAPDDAGQACPVRPNHKLRAARKAALMTQEELAEKVLKHEDGPPSCDRKTVYQWEMRGVIPRPRTQRAICAVLNKTPDELGWGPADADAEESDEPDPPSPFPPSPSLTVMPALPTAAPTHEEPAHNRPTHKGTDPVKRRDLIIGGGASTALALGAGGLEPLLEIIERIDAGKVSMADPALVALIGGMATAAVVDYENQHSAALAPVLAAERRWVEQFRQARQRHRAAIEAAACQLSGVLSATAADLGQHLEALAYGIDARAIADDLGDPNLGLFARAQQSNAASKAGRHAEAVELADEGLHVARQAGASPFAQLVGGRGPLGWTAPGNLAMWRAFSLAQLGRAGEEIRDTVARGLDTAGGGNFSEISWLSYAASHALLAAGELDAAMRHGDRALRALDQKHYPHTASLRLTLAVAIAPRDPSHAAELVTAAVAEIQVASTAIASSCLWEFVAKTRRMDAVEIREVRQQALELTRGSA
jgi:transcriptional regulator with XRE-family HTH domain